MVNDIHKESCRVIGRLMSSDPDFEDCEAAVELIKTLSEHYKGPDGFDTWRDAAVAERVLRVKAEADLAELRRTQPEATKPAQDLSTAILALPVPEIGGNFQQGFRTALLKAAALASPADALVAVDSEKLAQVREAVLKYFDDLSARRHGGVAQYHLINRIEEVLGMSWQSGVDHRAAIQAQKDGS